MHILFIAIDAPDCAAQRHAFANAGHVVTAVRDAGDAVDAVAGYAFDALVLACAGGDGAGPSLVRALNTPQRRTPIIVVVDKPQSGNIAQLLDQGADDVVCRATGTAVLLAHVIALVRRAHGHGRARIIIDDGLEIDLATSQCRLGGRAIHMTPMEYRLIEALALRRDTPVQRTRLLELLYGAESEGVAKSIDRFVYNIRNKFSGATRKRYLRTEARAFLLSHVQPQAGTTTVPA